MNWFTIALLAGNLYVLTGVVYVVLHLDDVTRVARRRASFGAALGFTLGCFVRWPWLVRTGVR